MMRARSSQGRPGFGEAIVGDVVGFDAEGLFDYLGGEALSSACEICQLLPWMLP
jgi:hypothetical protein